MRTRELLNAEPMSEEEQVLALIGKNWIIDQGIALKYGYDAALALSFLGYWHGYKKAHAESYKDGYYWTYVSIANLVKLYPCSTRAKMQAGIKRLVQDGVLLEGNYNALIGDKTKWYAVNEKHTLAKAYVEALGLQRKKAKPEGETKKGSTQVNCKQKKKNLLADYKQDLAENKQGVAENKQEVAENKQGFTENKQAIPNIITNNNAYSVSNKSTVGAKHTKGFNGMFDVAMLEGCKYVRG